MLYLSTNRFDMFLSPVHPSTLPDLYLPLIFLACSIVSYGFRTFLSSNAVTIFNQRSNSCFFIVTNLFHSLIARQWNIVGLKSKCIELIIDVMVITQ